MITCIIKGGLGNQLFQICCLISYAYTYHVDWYITNVNMVGNRHTYWNTVFIKLKPWLRDTSYNNLIIINEQNLIKYNSKTLGYIITKNNIMLDGYFQNYKYFEHAYNKIYNLLDISKLCMDVSIKYPYKYKSTTSLHFRYGDYKLLKDHYNILEYTYYYESILYILQNEPSSFITNNILIFYEERDYIYVSTIIDALKQNSLMSALHFIYIDTNIPDYDQMFIMSNCKNNIIANSTFSWWGAYFNIHPNTIICYPSIWYRHKLAHLNVSGLHPEKWIQIESNS